MAEDYLKRITNYIFDNRFTRALLIDGDWGCGKSYFVKNTLINAIDSIPIPVKKEFDDLKKDKKEKTNKPKYYRSVLVSLYGVSKIDSVQNAIYVAFLEKFTDSIKDVKLGFALKNAALFGMTAIKGAGAFFNVGDQTESLCSQVGEGLFTLQKENTVLIFDDIERCQIDIIELMGFLNNLCENNGYRVILIANEEEISRQEDGIAKAINAQTALIDLHENRHVILKDDRNRSSSAQPLFNSLQQNKDDLFSKINKRTIDSHREALFERDTLYERTREKLIGLTIRFSLRLEDVYEDVLNNTISDDRVSNFLRDKQSFIINAFEKYGHENLRTLISLFIGVEAMIDVFEVSPSLSDDEKKIIDVKSILQAEVNHLLTYLIYVAINKANGVELSKLTNGARYGYIHNGLHNKGELLLKYAFIDEYWETLVVDGEVAKNDFCKHIDESLNDAINRVHDKEHYDLSLFRLKEWYYLSDEEVIADIKRMKQELEKKKYYPYDFKDIIYTLMCINNADFGMRFGKEAESSNGHIYDATDEATFPNNNDEHKNEDQKNGNATKTDYNKWPEENIKEYIDLMLEYTEDEKLVLTSDMLRLLSENYDLAKKYRYYIQPLLDWINKKELEKLEKSDEGYNVLEIDSEELYKFFYDRRDSYITKRHFLSLYGYEGIEKYINNAPTKGLFDFADALSAVYSFSNLRDFFSEDYYTVNKVWFDLKTDRENDRKEFNIIKSRTREIALRRLETCFEKYRNLLRDPNEKVEE